MQATAQWLDVDFYDVLGVDQNAAKKQIKSAYRKLARTAHPDANPDDEGAEARFSDIAKAYEVLGDEDTRSEYDKLRAQAQRPVSPSDFGQWSSGSHGSAGYTNIGDLFGDLFAEQQTRPRRGSDISASLGLDFVDAVKGLTTALSVNGRSINVRIPAGVQDQQTIRLLGKGSPGLRVCRSPVSPVTSWSPSQSTSHRTSRTKNVRSSNSSAPSKNRVKISARYV